jgi:alpha-ribazole phosphatase
MRENIVKGAKPMPKLILVRHGQTVYNAERRYQGQSDIPLNETGLQQAALLASRLQKIRLTAAYSSDLIRASKTAEIALARHPSGLTPKISPLLREISGGGFEGLTWEEIVAKYPDLAHKWSDNRGWHTPPGGEPLADAQERINKAIAQIVEENPGEDSSVLIVAHGGIISVLICTMLGIDLNKLWQLRIDSCSLTILDLYDKGAILSLFNDTSHLDD